MRQSFFTMTTAFAICCNPVGLAYGPEAAAIGSAANRSIPTIEFSTNETTVIAKGSEIEKLCIACDYGYCVLFLEFLAETSIRLKQFSETIVNQKFDFIVNDVIVSKSVTVLEPIYFSQGGRSDLSRSEVKALRNATPSVPYCEDSNR